MDLVRYQALLCRTLQPRQVRSAPRVSMISELEYLVSDTVYARTRGGLAEQQYWQQQQYPVTALAYAPGNSPIVAIGDDRGCLGVWNTENTGDTEGQGGSQTERLRTFGMQVHDNPIYDVAWNRMAKHWLVSSSGDRTAMVVDVEGKRVMCRLEGHDGSVKCARWEPEHNALLITSSRDGSIATWDLRSRTSVGNFAFGPTHVLHPTRIISNCHVPAHQSLADASKRRKPVNSSMPNAAAPEAPVSHVEYHRSDIISSGTIDGLVKLWDLRFTRKPKVVSDLGALKASAVTSLARSAFGDKIFALRLDRSVMELSPCDLSVRRSIQLPTGPLSSTAWRQSYDVKCALSPDDKYLAIGSPEELVYIWDTDHDLCVTLENGHRTEVGCVAWRTTQDQHVLCSGSDDPVVRVWRVDDLRAKEVRKLLRDGYKANVEGVGRARTTIRLAVECPLLANGDKTLAGVPGAASSSSSSAGKKKQTTMEKYFPILRPASSPVTNSSASSPADKENQGITISTPSTSSSSPSSSSSSSPTPARRPRVPSSSSSITSHHRRPASKRLKATSGSRRLR